MLPFYKIVVNENDETGVDFNSFVDSPAHMKAYIAFGKAIHYSFNEEKRIVTGVMISVGTPIYRNDANFGEHYVLFDAPTVDLIRRKFFKNGFNSNLNTQHDHNAITKGATLVDSYIASNSDPKLPKFPEAFSKQNLQDGSWISSYYVQDNVLWNDVKEGKFSGFSVEGWFDKVKVNVKTNKTKMSKPTKSIWEMMGIVTKAKEVFTVATTADGVEVSYEGDLAIGTSVTVDLNGTAVPAPEGEHQVTLEDGTQKLIVVDGNGVLSDIQDVMEEEVVIEPTDNTELKAEVAEIMQKFIVDSNERFVAIENENKTLKVKLEAIAEGSKFKVTPKVIGGEDEKMTIKDILNNKK